jgi:hypothetical protein
MWWKTAMSSIFGIADRRRGQVEPPFRFRS